MMAKVTVWYRRKDFFGKGFECEESAEIYSEKAITDVLYKFYRYIREWKFPAVRVVVNGRAFVIEEDPNEKEKIRVNYVITNKLGINTLDNVYKTLTKRETRRQILYLMDNGVFEKEEELLG